MDLSHLPLWVEPAAWLFTHLVGAFAAAALFGHKGRSRAVGFVLALLIGPFGLLVALLVGPAATTAPR